MFIILYTLKVMTAQEHFSVKWYVSKKTLHQTTKKGINFVPSSFSLFFPFFEVDPQCSPEDTLFMSLQFRAYKPIHHVFAVPHLL